MSLTAVSLFAGVGGFDLALGFPDDWTAQRVDEKSGRVVAQADSARYRQMGNAVAVPVVEWIVGRIVAADGDL